MANHRLHIISGPHSKAKHKRLIGHEAVSAGAYFGSSRKRLQGLYHFLLEGFGAAVGSL